MRQTGDWKEDAPLTAERFKDMLTHAIGNVDIEQARKEVEPFVGNPAALSIWSKEFFLDVVTRIRFV